MIHETSIVASADSIPRGVSPDVLETEFACISTACRLYPRNYHAWAHRRFCVEVLIASLKSDASSSSSILAKEYQRTLKWVEAHISDYSAINYAINVEKMLPGGSPSAVFIPTKEHATSLLRSYPDHESLWMYLRGSTTLEGEKELIASAKEVPSVRQFALRHVVWRKFLVSSPIISAGWYLKNGTRGMKRSHSGRYVAFSHVTILKRVLVN